MKLKEYVVVIIISVFLSNVLNVVAQTIIPSESVSYSNSKTSEVTIEGALEDLFDAVDINSRLGIKDITTIGGTIVL